VQDTTTTVRHRLEALAEAADAIVLDYAEELVDAEPMEEPRSRAALRRCAAWLFEAAAVMELGPGIWVMSSGRYTTLDRMQAVILRVATQVVRHREALPLAPFPVCVKRET